MAEGGSREAGARFRLSAEPQEVLEGVYTSGEVPRITPFEKPDGRLVVRSDGGIVPDPLNDDLALVAAGERSLAVFFGCCHAGTVNTLERISGLFPGKRIAAGAGGFHLLNAGGKRIERTIDYLLALSPDVVAACHCTGFKASAFLHNAFGAKFRPLTTGDTLCL